jgi:hypothetical protein
VAAAAALASILVLLRTGAAADGVLQGVVRSADSGEALPARVVVAWEGGATVLFTGADGRFEWPTPEGYAGSVTVTASHGLEYAPASAEVQAPALPEVSLRLQRIADMKALGWFAGDTHAHSTYSDGSQSPAEVARAAVAEGLDWAVLSDHNTLDHAQEWLAAGSPRFLPIVGEEVTTNLGHVVAINISRLVHWQVAAPEDFARIFDEIRVQGGVVSVAHPTAPGHMYQGAQDVVPDAIEVINGGMPPVGQVAAAVQARARWFEVLNSGSRVPGVGGSDCHDVTSAASAKALADPEAAAAAVPERFRLMVALDREALLQWLRRGLFLGTPRTYLRLPDRSSQDVVMALREGRAFVTNSALLLGDIAGRGPGEAVQVLEGQEVTVNVWARSATPIRRLAIIANGREVWQKRCDGMLEVRQQVPLTIEAPGWIVVESYGDPPDFAFTNPIYLQAKP